MNKYNVSISAVLLVCASGSWNAASASDLKGGEHEWLSRPWEIRYIIFVDTTTNMLRRTQIAQRINVAGDKPGQELVHLDAEAMFDPSATFAVGGKPALTTVVVSFDSTGRVVTPAGVLKKFIAKRTPLDVLILVQTDAIERKAFYLADWSQGIPGDATFSPAVCTISDMHRYAPGWKRGSAHGDFGCREWTAQLNRWEQPYIDVTTYNRRGNYIGEFVGWARFGDAPRPVIGMHGKHWLCLHECPAGEMPGVIDDLRAWTRKHNFPMPVRPKSQPEYPDSHYQDDLNEFGD